MTARSKGKVERPFRTVKEAHETLYHFHTPQNEAEANLWLRQLSGSLQRPAAPVGSTFPGGRLASNLPPAGYRAMCAWDRFRTFAREPERRRVGIDARVQVDGVSYEVDPSLAGETVTLWWGLFDHELFVEHEDSGSAPSGRSTAQSRCTATAASANPRPMNASIGSSAGRQAGPAARGAGRRSVPIAAAARADATRGRRSTIPDPFHELRFPSVLAAKLAIADYLGARWRSWRPRTSTISTALLRETLERRTIITCVRGYFRDRAQRRQGEDGEHAR